MKLLRPVFLMLAALVLAACATTTIRSAWFDTSYKGGPMKRIVVVGVGGQVADRRVFEDSFAAQLRAAGVDGIPGCQEEPKFPQSWESNFPHLVKDQDSVVSSARTRPAFSFSFSRYELPRMFSVTA